MRRLTCVSVDRWTREPPPPGADSGARLVWTNCYDAHVLGAATTCLPALPMPQQRAVLVELIAPGPAGGLPAAPRYAVVVPDGSTGRRVAGVVTSCDAGIPAAARASVAAAHGDATADVLVVGPLDVVPLTEQGKPDRPAIRRLDRCVAA